MPFIASATDTGSPRSPRAISTASGNKAGFGFLRVKARTPAPRWRSALTTSFPTLPLAPMTRTFTFFSVCGPAVAFESAMN
jgi:ABC-type antimicrobial peptide transport system permease subunit